MVFVTAMVFPEDIMVWISSETEADLVAEGWIVFVTAMVFPEDIMVCISSEADCDADSD
jgi:3-methyladenine DNA glycosylase AlkD